MYPGKYFDILFLLQTYPTLGPVDKILSRMGPSFGERKPEIFPLLMRISKKLHHFPIPTANVSPSSGSSYPAVIPTSARETINGSRNHAPRRSGSFANFKCWHQFENFKILIKDLKLVQTNYDHVS